MPGDEKYLKGIYQIPEQELNVSSVVDMPGTYSIFLDGSKVAEPHAGEILYYIEKLWKKMYIWTRNSKPDTLSEHQGWTLTHFFRM